MSTKTYKEYQRQWKIDNPEKYKQSKQNWKDNLRLEVLTHYSQEIPICACPGCNIKEILFLTIDHISGGGKKHRQEIGTQDILFWLKKNNYPDGFQVLCMNCNFAKKKNLYCPVHQPKEYQEYRNEHPESYNYGMIKENHPFYGKHHTEESNQKNREKHLGKPAWNKGIPHIEESNEKNRQAHLGKVTIKKNYIITFPNGEKQKINNLAKFCRENNLDRGNMINVANGKYKQNKGFVCQYVH